jgi:hypothetical protein
MRARSMAAIATITAIAAIAGGCDESAFTRARAAASASASTAGSGAPSADSSAPASSVSAEKPPWWGGPCGSGSLLACMSPAFRRCYQAGLHGGPWMGGQLRIRAQIGPEGEVTSAKAERVTGLSPEMVACMEKRVSIAHFSPPEGGSATIVIPVTFVPGDEAPDAGLARGDGGTRAEH